MNKQVLRILEIYIYRYLYIHMYIYVASPKLLLTATNGIFILKLISIYLPE